MKPRILLIYTGGTIGMMANPSTGELQSLDFDYIHQQIPEIARLDLEVIPISITQPIDSSHMQPAHWIELVELIAQHEATVDGFVILHGTDTMAETASLLESKVKNKTIVLTGAMVPYKFGSSDGLFNLGSALAFVQSLPHGVYVAMNGKIFKGNNVRKNKATGEFELLEP